MTKDERLTGSRWLLATVLTVAAYHLSILGLLFLVPLQWIRSRQGESSFIAASVAALVGIAVVEAAIKGAMASPWSVLDLAVLGLPAVLIVGWVSIALMERLGWRFLYRLTAVTAVAGVFLFPAVNFLFQQEAFVRVLEKSFDAVWTQVFQSPGFDAGLAERLNKTEFFALLKESFLGSFLLLFFLVWAFTGRVSRIFSAEQGKTLKDFFLPPQGAAALLLLWGGLLVQGFLGLRGVQWDWGFIQYVWMNAAWITLVVYALAGWGIVNALMERWKWPRLGQSVARVILVLMLILPGAGQIVMLVGLPILAVLELWVNLRNRQGVGL